MGSQLLPVLGGTVASSAVAFLLGRVNWRGRRGRTGHEGQDAVERWKASQSEDTTEASSDPLASQGTADTIDDEDVFGTESLTALYLASLPQSEASALISQAPPELQEDLAREVWRISMDSQASGRRGLPGHVSPWPPQQQQSLSPILSEPDHEREHVGFSSLRPRSPSFEDFVNPAAAEALLAAPAAAAELDLDQTYSAADPHVAPQLLDPISPDPLDPDMGLTGTAGDLQEGFEEHYVTFVQDGDPATATDYLQPCAGDEPHVRSGSSSRRNSDGSDMVLVASLSGGLAEHGGDGQSEDVDDESEPRDENNKEHMGQDAAIAASPLPCEEEREGADTDSGNNKEQAPVTEAVGVEAAPASSSEAVPYAAAAAAHSDAVATDATATTADAATDATATTAEAASDATASPWTSHQLEIGSFGSVASDTVTAIAAAVALHDAEAAEHVAAARIAAAAADEVVAAVAHAVAAVEGLHEHGAAAATATAAELAGGAQDSLSATDAATAEAPTTPEPQAPPSTPRRGSLAGPSAAPGPSSSELKKQVLARLAALQSQPPSWDVMQQILAAFKAIEAIEMMEGAPCDDVAAQGPAATPGLVATAITPDALAAPPLAATAAPAATATHVVAMAAVAEAEGRRDVPDATAASTPTQGAADEVCEAPADEGEVTGGSAGTAVVVMEAEAAPESVESPPSKSLEGGSEVAAPTTDADPATANGEAAVSSESLVAAAVEDEAVAADTSAKASPDELPELEAAAAVEAVIEPGPLPSALSPTGDVTTSNDDAAAASVASATATTAPDDEESSIASPQQQHKAAYKPASPFVSGTTSRSSSRSSSPSAPARDGNLMFAEAPRASAAAAAAAAKHRLAAAAAATATDEDGEDGDCVEVDAVATVSGAEEPATGVATATATDDISPAQVADTALPAPSVLEPPAAALEVATAAVAKASAPAGAPLDGAALQDAVRQALLQLLQEQGLLGLHGLQGQGQVSHLGEAAQLQQATVPALVGEAAGPEALEAAAVAEPELADSVPVLMPVLVEGDASSVACGGADRAEGLDYDQDQGHQEQGLAPAQQLGQLMADEGAGVAVQLPMPPLAGLPSPPGLDLVNPAAATTAVTAELAASGSDEEDASMQQLPPGEELEAPQADPDATAASDGAAAGTEAADMAGSADVEGEVSEEEQQRLLLAAVEASLQQQQEQLLREMLMLQEGSGAAGNDDDGFDDDDDDDDDEEAWQRMTAAGAAPLPGSETAVSLSLAPSSDAELAQPPQLAAVVVASALEGGDSSGCSSPRQPDSSGSAQHYHSDGGADVVSDVEVASVSALAEVVSSLDSGSIRGLMVSMGAATVAEAEAGAGSGGGTTLHPVSRDSESNFSFDAGLSSPPQPTSDADTFGISAPLTITLEPPVLPMDRPLGPASPQAASPQAPSPPAKPKTADRLVSLVERAAAAGRPCSPAVVEVVQQVKALQAELERKRLASAAAVTAPASPAATAYQPTLPAQPPIPMPSLNPVPEIEPAVDSPPSEYSNPHQHHQSSHSPAPHHPAGPVPARFTELPPEATSSNARSGGSRGVRFASDPAPAAPTSAGQGVSFDTGSAGGVPHAAFQMPPPLQLHRLSAEGPISPSSSAGSAGFDPAQLQALIAGVGRGSLTGPSADFQPSMATYGSGSSGDMSPPLPPAVARLSGSFTTQPRNSFLLRKAVSIGSNTVKTYDRHASPTTARHSSLIRKSMEIVGVKPALKSQEVLDSHGVPIKAPQQLLQPQMLQPLQPMPYQQQAGVMMQAGMQPGSMPMPMGMQGATSMPMGMVVTAATAGMMPSASAGMPTGMGMGGYPPAMSAPNQGAVGGMGFLPQPGYGTPY